MKEVKSQVFQMDVTPTLEYVIITYRKNMVEDAIITKDIRTSFESS